MTDVGQVGILNSRTTLKSSSQMARTKDRQCLNSASCPEKMIISLRACVSMMKRSHARLGSGHQCPDRSKYGVLKGPDFLHPANRTSHQRSIDHGLFSTNNQPPAFLPP